MAPDLPDRLAACRAEVEDAVLLLPGFDELVLGYADRTCAVPAEFADRIVPGQQRHVPADRRARRAGAGHVAVEGQRRASGSPAPEPFTAFPDDVAAAIPEVAAALP